MNPIIWIVIAIVGLVIVLWFFPVALWFQAVLSGVYVSLIQLVLMRWRGVNPRTIVMALITGTKAGLTLKANELEAHYLARGNVTKVVKLGVDNFARVKVVTDKITKQMLDDCQLLIVTAPARRTMSPSMTSGWMSSGTSAFPKPLMRPSINSTSANISRELSFMGLALRVISTRPVC